MKERSLVAFTLLAQAAAGLCWTLGGLQAWLTARSGPGPWDAVRPAWLAVPLLAGAAVLASFLHLGAPRRAWRALSNLPRSWLSREILCAVLFLGAATACALLQWGGPSTAAWGAASLAGLALIYAMARAYRLRTVPAWDTPLTLGSFLSAALLLGALETGVVLLFTAHLPPEWLDGALRGLAGWAAALLGVELLLAVLWLRALAGTATGRQSARQVTGIHGGLFKLRLALGVAALLAAALALPGTPARGAALAAALGLALAGEVLGRRLFYAARLRVGV